MNTGAFLTKSARTYPDRPAIIHGDRTITYEEFNDRANRLANALLHLGVRQGDNVALLQYNYPEMLESMFACFKAGLGAVPIKFRLHPREFAFIIDHSQAKAALLSSLVTAAYKFVRVSQTPHALRGFQGISSTRFARLKSHCFAAGSRKRKPCIRLLSYSLFAW